MPPSQFPGVHFMIDEKFRVTRWHKLFRNDGIVAVLHTLSLAVL